MSKQFGEKFALDGVSLDVEPGTFLVLLGPSGSGKTTLLRCLAGIERPSGGSITIDGRLVVGGKTFVAPDKRHLAMVFQDYALWPPSRFEKTWRSRVANTELSKTDREKRCNDLLDRVGIGTSDRYR